MKERKLKINLKNMTASETGPQPLQGHASLPESPALLFSDGTTVRISKDHEGNLILRITEK
jgi:hypothetical protein